MTTTQMQAHPCPSCHAELSAATDYTGQGNKPSTGDMTVCAYCATILQFDDEMHLQVASQQALIAAPIDTLVELQRVRNAVLTRNAIQQAKDSSSAKR